MLKLLDIIPDIMNEKEKFKIHFAIGRINRREPLYSLIQDEFKEWQEYQNNKNFEREYILSLIYYQPSEWIFGGIYRQLGVEKVFNDKKKKEYWRYQTQLLPFQTELIGRMIIDYKKEFRQSYVLLENYYNDLNISEILKEPYRIDQFPGYENVIIDYSLLKEIIKMNELSWKTALSNIKGVYLITDKTNGKQYVGSAYGENAFWNRWSDYAKNGHGNNKELKRIISENDIEYALNFQLSILEIRSAIVDDELIIEREKHWKNMLMSKEFGYNEN